MPKANFIEEQRIPQWGGGIISSLEILGYSHFYTIHFRNSIMLQFLIATFKVLGFEKTQSLFWNFQIWLDSHLISQTSDDPYNDSQKKLIREAVRRVDQALKMSSMEAIPIHKYEFYRWWIWSSIMLNWDSRQSSRQNSIWVFVWLVFPIFWKQITAKKWSC